MSRAEATASEPRRELFDRSGQRAERRFLVTEDDALRRLGGAPGAARTPAT
jgi:hypothetical protein